MSATEPRPRRLRPNRFGVVAVLGAVVVTALAAYAYRSSYGGVEFLVVATVAAALAALLAFVAAQLRWTLVVTMVAAVAGYLVLTSVVALRHQCIAGFLPSPTSVLNALTSAATGWKELLTTSPPVGRTGDLMVIPVFSGYASAFLAVTLSVRTRWPALAMLPPLVVLAVAIAVGTEEPVSVLLHGAVLAGVLIAWAARLEHLRRPLLDGRRGGTRRVVSAGLLLGVAGAAGHAIAPSLPGAAAASERAIWRQTIVPPFDPFDYPSPLAGYRTYVKLPRDPETQAQLEAKVMFTVEGLPEGVPLRLATMDAYDGLVWQVSGGDPDRPSLRDSGSFERVGASIDADFGGDVAEVTVTIREYADVWIPDVGEVERLVFTGSEGGPERDRELAASFRYNRATDTAATPLRLRPGDRYTMTVRLPRQVEQLAGQEFIAEMPGLGQARQVQALSALGTPDLLALDDTGARLERVRDLFVTTGAYSDGDVAANQIRARAGHSAHRLEEFAGGFPERPFVGNAEQYAATYALLFRDLDKLPTRVVMGFKPERASLDEPVDVLATDVDAWVEVPVQRIGWVAIEPTPPRDQNTYSTTAPLEPEPDYRTQNPPPPPLVDPEFDRPALTRGEAQELQEEVDEEPTVPTSDPAAPNPIGRALSSPVFVGAAIASSPFVLALLGGVLVAAVKILRRRRRRTRGAPHERIAAGWLEVTDLATDLRRPVPPSTTRREAASFVGPSAVALAVRADESVWGGRELSDADVEAYWRELTETLGSLRAEVGFATRVRAAMSLRSLRRSRPDTSGGRKR